MRDSQNGANDSADEMVLFEDEVDAGDDDTNRRTWRILIVDDDPEVHQATRLALQTVSIIGRHLTLIHAYSAGEARQVLENEGDIAVILLDVVMESQDAGLRLVKVIREDLGCRDTRIILRTGQPGYAPEVDVIRAYDINDYRNKSELTLVRLFTALTSAIRSYDQIRSLEASRQGLSMIIGSSATLMATHGLQEFAEGVIIQITGLLGLPSEGILCVEAPDDRLTVDEESGMVLAAAGRFRNLMARPVVCLEELPIRSAIEKAFATQKSVSVSDGIALYISGRSSRHLVAYVETHKPLDVLDVQLLEVFCTNISIGFENVTLFSQMRDAAYVDALTGLPNRQQLAINIESEAGGGGRDWLVMLDIHQFSDINDAFGFAFGNAVLQGVAGRLMNRFGDECAVSRIGGDVFALFGSRERLAGQRVLEAFSDPFEIEGEALHVSISLGCSKALAGENSAEIIRAAGIALKRAKLKAAGTVCEFEADMGGAARERVSLLHDLRRSASAKALRLAFQPQIRLADGALVGVEALLRWPRDDGRPVPPDVFIPLAESSGLIVEIGEWVTHEACAQMVGFAQQLALPLRIGINVSVVQLGHPQFLANLEGIAASLGDRVGRVEIEVTESVAMHDPEFSGRTIAAIKALGFKVAIDDFGTGFSSLAYLQELAVDRLKIDKRFVNDLGQARGDQIVRTIIQLGRALDLEVIAEGVETEAQAVRLRELGCHEGQGYLFSRPVYADDFMRWALAKRGA